MMEPFQKLRFLLQEEPSSSSYSPIYQLLDSWPTHKDKEKALLYAKEHLRDWPAELLWAEPHSDCLVFAKHLQLSSISEVSPEKYRDIEFLSYTGKKFDELLAFENLRSLSLSTPNKTCRSLSPLSKLPKLECLRISMSSLVDCNALGDFTQLRELRITDDTDEFRYEDHMNVDFLEEMTSLVALDIDCAPISDLTAIRACESLEKLELYGCIYLGDKDYAAIATLPGIKQCNLSHHRMEHVDGLEEAESLVSLSLSACYELQNIDGLRKLKNLTSLDLYRCWELVDLKSLQSLEKLETLNLDECDRLRIKPPQSILHGSSNIVSFLKRFEH